MTSRRPRAGTTLSRRTGAVVSAVLLVALLVAGRELAQRGSDPEPATGPAVTGVTATGVPSPVTAERDPETGLPWADLDRLPLQAQQTVAVIDRGGPFRYRADGATFGNRERRLPIQPSGFYREYTVVTPGEDDRGARRLVTGEASRQLFYTGDHYASFVRVRR